jgi:hypothetical protein
MTTINLPPDIEGPLIELARQTGSTPESLALQGLRRLFGPAVELPPNIPGASLYDYLSEFIGVVDGTSEPLSENCGRRFREGLAERQRRNGT